MPRIDLNGANIHFTDSGGEGPIIVFSHGLLMSGEMFAEQVAHFQDRYRCITFDHRGQGQSGVTQDGYDMETLTEDASALIKYLGVAPCHFVGLSMGGFVGIRLAAQKPDMLKTLTLLGSSIEAEPNHIVVKYRMLNFVARWIGLWAVVGSVMPIMFGKTFLNDTTRVNEKRRWSKAISGNQRIGITRAVTGAIKRRSCSDILQRIQIPVGIGAGDEDVATGLQQSERIHALIGGSELAVLKGAGHSSSIETPNLVSDFIEQTIRRSR